jgi:hypothetical protein
VVADYANHPSLSLLFSTAGLGCPNGNDNDQQCSEHVRLACHTVNRNKTDLLKQLGELKTELLSLRVQKIAGGSAAKLTKM